MTMNSISPLAHQVEYYRLRLAQNEDDGIRAWSVAAKHWRRSDRHRVACVC